VRGGRDVSSKPRVVGYLADVFRVVVDQPEPDVESVPLFPVEPFAQRAVDRGEREAQRQAGDEVARSAAEAGVPCCGEPGVDGEPGQSVAVGSDETDDGAKGRFVSPAQQAVSEA
jgi:hypothetical protein